MATAKTTGQWNTFGAFAQDANREKMDSFPNYFITNDATGTPVTSPVSVSNSSATTLTVPVGAVTCTIYATTALRVSELSSVAQYFLIPATTSQTFPCTRQTNIYLKGDAGAVTTQFYFSNV